MDKVIVTEPSSNIRLLTRQILDGQWKKVTVAFLIYLVCALVPVIIIEILFGSLSPEALEAAVNGSEEFTFGTFIGSVYSMLIEGAVFHGDRHGAIGEIQIA